jgi:preprotein translocase SecE subunit
MAVAVKNEPEATPRSPLNRLAVGSWLGIAYVVGSIAVVFHALPALWWELTADLNKFVAGSLLFMVVLAAAAGALALGLVLLHRHPIHGLRAGIFVGLVGLLIIGWIATSLGGLLETRELTETVGLVATAVPAAGLLLLLVWLYFRPGFGRWLGRVEDQGWFHAAGYKSNQGVRVRRGTILALLVLGGCGVYTLLHHGSLDRAGDWEFVVPFTAETHPVTGATTYLTVPLLPDARYTVPLLLLGLILWVSWRIVNWPVFADFLIATEAEMNKVSWTTRRRLFQDTIVVLVTVFLLTAFLFVVDVVWIKVLSWRPISVLVVDIGAERQKLNEQAQW